MEYLAHIAKDGRRETIEQHLYNTAELAAHFSSAFDSADQGTLAGIAHDIGKYSEAFQRRLAGSPEHVDHSTAGAWECMKSRQQFAAIAVAGHHGGLPDGGGRGDHPEKSTFLSRMNRARQGLLEPYDHWNSPLPFAELPDFLKKSRDPATMMFYERMLYSALVDADFLATETFMNGSPRTEHAFNGEQLERLLREYVKNWFPPQGELNQQRCAILRQCIREGEKCAQGLFSLTVPTGGGKTVSSLAFALAHARRCGLQRIIYVIPYTSIIDQTAKIFRDILGPDVVLEHHSGVTCDINEEADPETVHVAQATENWDMPVIVTTAVQFFESLYGNRSSKCRKLHNIAKSVVIFDEAQMLPIPYLRPCVHAIGQLVQHYHVSAVLCTATQPALEPVFRSFYPKLDIHELCPKEIYRSSVFRRVTFQKEGRLSWTELAQKVSAHPQVLCIVNSRAGAQKLYELLEGEGTFHLSTLMFPAHRQQVLDEIRQRLKRNQLCRVVSTSLIEAGVDVDFPVVFREESGLDSILQAAGRCNREGKRDYRSSVVTVFSSEDKTPPLFSIPIAAARKTMQYFDDISDPAAIRYYFQELLDLKGTAAQDKEQILNVIEKELFPFETVANRFHLIDSPTRTVYIPLGEGAQLTDRLQSGEHSLSLMRQLGRYGVSVYEQHFNALLEAAAITIVDGGNSVLNDLTLYSGKTGLSLKADSGKALFV